MNKASPTSVNEMVAFKDSAEAWEYKVDSEPDYTYEVCDNSDADLGNFFSRPIKIQQFSWGTGTTLFEAFNPWQDFFENKRVINRVSNYNLMRANLHVKFIINGNGFHYGRLIASYNPYLPVDEVTVDRAFFTQDVIQASQKPHVYLDPTLSQGGEIACPFMWPNNYLSVPDSDWRQMGNMKLQTLQGLKHANDATDTVTISVFAWAENVTLAVPTSSEPAGITPQAGDEYGKGPISRPASIVARAAGSLKDAPLIGPYMRATEMAANAVDGVATTFGYSRPIVLNETLPYRPNPMGNLTNVNIPDSSTKLSTDCKQEITVDPTTVGLGRTDEMTINSMACRESYLTQFGWPVGQPPESPLWNCEVTPMIWDFLPTSTEDEIHLPACAYATLPFGAWRGSMKYRFQIVSSAYHKGRIKIVYEPHQVSSNEYNTNYTYIVDIAEDKDFTLDIGWGSDQAWCVVAPPGIGKNVNQPPHSAGGTGVLPGDRANGILTVYVVNDLTVPNSVATNDIAINVFVSAGEDLCVANPSNNIDEFSFFRTPGAVSAQAGDEQGDADKTDEPSKPMDQELDHTILSRMDCATAYDHVFYGESIISFRALLKRYNRAYYTLMLDPPSAPILTTTIARAFPPYRGYAPGAIYDTVGARYNYGTMTLMNYLTPAFAAWRGGIRVKVNPTNTSNNFYKSSAATATRLPDSTIGFQQTKLFPLFNILDTLQILELANTATASGAVATNDVVNPVLEFEIPFQSRKRFQPARNFNVTGSFPGSDFQSTSFQVQRILEMQSGDVMLDDYHIAAAEDFSLFMFTGGPILYYNVFPGTPTP